MKIVCQFARSLSVWLRRFVCPPRQRTLVPTFPSLNTAPASRIVSETAPPINPLLRWSSQRARPVQAESRGGMFLPSPGQVEAWKVANAGAGLPLASAYRAYARELYEQDRLDRYRRLTSHLDEQNSRLDVLLGSQREQEPAHR